MNRPLINIPQERTEVGTESEVRIPVLTATWCAIAGDVSTLAIVLVRVFWLLWKHGFRVTGQWIAAWWGALAISLAVPWFVSFAFLFVSFGIQTIDKHWPAARKVKDGDSGILTGIFSRRSGGLISLIFGQVDDGYNRRYQADDE